MLIVFAFANPTLALLAKIFESFFRLDVFPLAIINRSAVCRTLAFMAMSQFILNSKRVHKSDVFWFIKPTIAAKTVEAEEKQQQQPPAAKRSLIMDALVPSERHVCLHPETCDRHIYRVKCANRETAAAGSFSQHLFDHREP